MRVFCALDIHFDKQLVDYFYNVKQRFIHEKFKWVNIKNTHLTLKFYGEISDLQLQKIDEFLNTCTINCPPFTIETNKLGNFGKSVIWLGLEKSEIFKKLQLQIEQESEKLGLNSDYKEFNPHITLARINSIVNPNEFKKVIDDTSLSIQKKIKISEFHLYQSILWPQGAEYKIVKTYKLKTN